MPRIPCEPENNDASSTPSRCLACPAFNKVLLVQETAAADAALEDCLRQRFARVDLGIGSQRALSEVREADYEFVLWHCQVPQREEIESLRHCRQRCPRLPVLILADVASAEMVIELMKAGASDFLAKPWAQPNCGGPWIGPSKDGS